MSDTSPAEVGEARLPMFFVTVPSRIGSPRFNAYFSSASLDCLDLSLVLKRREPRPERDANGVSSMGWTNSCTEEEFAHAAVALSRAGRRVWLNLESGARPTDLELLSSDPTFGALVSGHGLSPQGALDVFSALPVGSPVVLALESQEMLMAGAALLEAWPLAGLVIGSSYLSESSKMYDQLGLDRYRSLTRGLANRAVARGCLPITTSNYCTFEPTGSGDKSKAFVAEQVEFVSRYSGWGTITRFYSHLDIANATRAAWAQRKNGGGMHGV